MIGFVVCVPLAALVVGVGIGLEVGVGVGVGVGMEGGSLVVDAGANASKGAGAGVGAGAGEEDDESRSSSVDRPGLDGSVVSTAKDLLSAAPPLCDGGVHACLPRGPPPSPGPVEDDLDDGATVFSNLDRREEMDPIDLTSTLPSLSSSSSAAEAGSTSVPVRSPTRLSYDGAGGISWLLFLLWGRRLVTCPDQIEVVIL